MTIRQNVQIEQVKLGQYDNFSYLIIDTETKDAAVVDPAWDVPNILGKIRSDQLTLAWIINTHSHFDHIDGNMALAQATRAKIVMSIHSLAKKDIGVKDEDLLKIGKNVNLRFILTPGHSPESMCILVNDIALLTGDTLFIGECGRVDLPGGSAEELYESFKKIRNLNPALLVYPGHDYGKKPYSSLGEQLRTNYTLEERSKEEFVKFMNEP